MRYGFRNACFRRAAAVWIVLLLTLVAGPARAQRVTSCQIETRLLPNDTLEVSERYLLDPGGKPLGPLSRVLYLHELDGAFPLFQRVDGIRVTRDGQPAPFLTVPYGGDRVRVDLGVIDHPTTLELRYTRHRVATFGSKHDTVSFSVDLEHGWKIPFEQIRLTQTLPLSAERFKAVWTGDLPEGVDSLLPSERKVGGTLVRVFAPPPSTGLDVSVDTLLPKGAIQEPGFHAYVSGLWREARLPLATAAALLILALLLRLLPPVVTVYVMPVFHMELAVLGIIVAAVFPLYWLRGTPGAISDHPIVAMLEDALPSLIVLALLILPLWRQTRRVLGDEPTVWAHEIMVPFLMIPFIVEGLSGPTGLLVPLAGLPILVCWLRPRLALYLGATLDPIVERVLTDGAIRLDALAKAVGLPPARLRVLLRRNPQLPVVPDYAEGTVYSPANAALRHDLAVCPNCGGATTSAGMELEICRYCYTEYATSRTAASPPPAPPFIVEVCRELIDSVAHSLWYASLKFQS